MKMTSSVFFSVHSHGRPSPAWTLLPVPPLPIGRPAACLGDEEGSFFYEETIYNDNLGDITRFTTGALLPDGQLAYQKDMRDLREAYPNRFELAYSEPVSHVPVEKVNTSPHFPTAEEPDFLMDGFRMIEKGLRTIFLGKGM